MIPKDLKKLIAAGESQAVEFKESFGDEAMESIAAFANSTGGVLLVGIADNCSIKGVQLGKETLRVWANKIAQATGLNPNISEVKLAGKSIVSVNVAESPVKPVPCCGRYFRRVDKSNRRVTDDDLTRIVLEKVGVTWDEVPETRAKVSDIDDERLAGFRALCNEKRRRLMPQADSDQAVLDKLGLLKNGKPLRAALLLFGREPQRWYPSASVKIGRFRPGNNIVDDKEVGGTLFDQIDSVMEYFREHLQTRFKLTGAPAREVIWEYPLEALREAVTNAVCHRDYMDVSQTQVRWYDDQILILNPGGLIPPLNPQALLRMHVSKQRNRKIAEMLYYAGLIEKWGSGTLEIMRSCAKAGLPAPRFEEDQGALWVTFSHKGLSGKGSEKSSEKGSEKSSEKVLALIAANRLISAAEIATGVGLTPRAVEKTLSKLKAAGRLKRIGPDKGGHWEVTDKQK
jgi:ATP-dependent DNA helicase RecG